MVLRALPSVPLTEGMKGFPRSRETLDPLDVAAPRLWTIGHSTRTWPEFLDPLREHGIEVLVDVRRFPSSRRAPWANGDALVGATHASGLEYTHLAELGGFRRPRPGSRNTGWRSEGFRGYADHMETRAFRVALEALLGTAVDRRVAVMCAEAVPWRCHRSLLSDALLARGVRVVHILGPGKAQDHRLTAFARVRGGRVTYPGPPASPAKAHKPPRR